MYLDKRGLHSLTVIEHIRMGYAPGQCLRSWLTPLGYALSMLQQAGLTNAAGYDSSLRCIVCIITKQEVISDLAIASSFPT